MSGLSITAIEFQIMFLFINHLFPFKRYGRFTWKSCEEERGWVNICHYLFRKRQLYVGVGAQREGINQPAIQNLHLQRNNILIIQKEGWWPLLTLEWSRRICSLFSISDRLSLQNGSSITLLQIRKTEKLLAQTFIHPFAIKYVYLFASSLNFDLCFSLANSFMES